VSSREQVHRTWMHSDKYIPQRFIQPIQQFMRIEAASGVLMLLAAVAAIAWANAPFGETYHEFWSTPVLIEIGSFHLNETLEAIVNDGLMAIFFFVVGLEIKRELAVGELRDPKAAAFPVIAAVGGMALPALIYVLIVGTGEPDALRGWAVPMATDIAFSLGVLSLLGRRVPSGAKLFLLALAIVDDIGGILVIAFFYTEELNLGWLTAAIVGFIVIGWASRVGIRSNVFYAPIAIAIWFFTLESGVHATIAGVVLGFLTPAFPMYGVKELDLRARRILDTYPAAAETPEQREHADYEAMLLADIAREAVSPLTRAEHRLQLWSSFLIVPIFALANAGVRFEGGVVEPLLSPVALGVALGLLLGKTAGITTFGWAAVKLRLGRLPASTNYRHLVGVAATAGIGFTVALFITALAFVNPEFSDAAKVGIFAGSIVSGLIGVTILLRGPRREHPEVAGMEPADEGWGA
jgi:NhaA family Na+:H+ antiporter